MIKIITRVLIALIISLTSAHGQKKQTFEQKAKRLSIKIDSITVAERKALKNDIKAIEKRYNSDDEVTFAEIESLKKDAALLHANNIKIQVAKVEKELHDLVQNRVNEKTEAKKYFANKKSYYEWRTLSDFYVAAGFNNLVDNDDLGSIQDSPFEFAGSRFFEFGVNFKHRLFKERNLFYINYGLALRYNNLSLKDNQYFVKNDGIATIETHPLDLKRSTFKNVQLVAPVFLEFDFSKRKSGDKASEFRHGEGFRFGIGGFGGVNLKSKQILRYKLDGKNVKEKTRGDFDVNNFVYGLNAFIGHGRTSFYVKYDLNDLFKDSFENQKNLSFGVRLELM
jgi:hypothetical protein